ncbi:unnamed protein product [Paramecium sonneborni]|uniref:non-specific serine/threonine protein kinase n=1 Tax=Paramecium sonneborni TaxID=65129 RepID=A0A8S1RF52_9CILI|nr:unnamed protein product [Paramecium sonneborni]
MGSICQSHSCSIEYTTQLSTSVNFLKPIIDQHLEDEIMEESLSPLTDFEKEFTTTKSIIPKSPDVLQRSPLNSQTPNDSIVIQKFHITSDDFVKFRFQNYADSYLIERSLGSGSYGEVFIVRNKQTNQLRAMKQIKKQQSSLSKKSLREMEILSKLDHPFIVKAIEVFQDEQSYNMIIELLQGTDIQEDIQNNSKFTEDKAANIGYQLLLAISYIHNQDVVHRDIKPENILYQYNNGNTLIKLIDFGISTEIKKNRKLSSQLGSMYFMAPEIFSKDYGKQIDIWACGVTLFYMIHKRYPFMGRTNQEMKNAIKSGKLSFDKSISLELQALLNKMLQVNPNKRITAQQALQEDWFIKHKFISQINQQLIFKLINYHSTTLFEELIFSLITYYCQNCDDHGQAIQTFLFLDSDQDGLISKQEFKKSLNQLEINYSSQLIDDLYTTLNKHSDDTLTFKEFLAASVARDKIQTKKCQKICFQLIDYDQDGKISEQDFCHLMGKNHSNLWHVLNPSDNLYITEEEFYYMFKS